MSRFILLAVAILALLAAACSSKGGGKPTGTAAPQLQPIAGNSELIVGPNRFTIAFVDQSNERILEAGNSVHLAFYDPSGALKDEQDATFVWAIPDVTGYWVANVTFDSAGTWSTRATVTTSGTVNTVNIGFPVAEQGIAPAVGDAAPATDNLTLSQNPNIKRLSTDPQPNMAFYEMTVTQAIDAHEPFVVIFATPLFCTSQFCGPLLNNVKAVAPDFIDRVNFIHIEPYNLDENGHLATDADGQPVAAPPTEAWRLRTEPWLFVVGADGKITSRFEGTASAEELRAAIGQVAGS
jgi:hypothetical protein